MTRAIYKLMFACALLAFAPQIKTVHTEVTAQGHAVIHILSVNDNGEAVGEAVTAPLFAFRINGSLDGAAILECQQNTETKQNDEQTYSYPVIVLKCGDVKLELVGVDLTVKGGK